MTAILFAVLALFGWGVGDIAGTVSSRRTGSLKLAFWLSLFNAILLIPGIFIFKDDLLNLSADTLLLLIGLGVLINYLFLIFFRALTIGNAPLVGAIAGSFPMIVVPLSIISFNEHLTGWQLVAISFIIVGIFLSSVDVATLRRRHFHMDKGTAMAFIPLVGWGVYFTYIRIPLEEVGWFWVQYFSSAIGVVFLWLIGRKKVLIAKKDVKRSANPIILATILTTLGTIFFYVALSRGKSSVVAPIAGSYPALFAVLAYFYFKEKLTVQQVLGAVTTLAGIIALGIVTGQA